MRCPARPRPRWGSLALLVMIALTAAGCGVLDESAPAPGRTEPTPSAAPIPTLSTAPSDETAAGPTAAPAATSTTTSGELTYRWRPIPVGGGGWVTGIVAHPSAPDVLYARTDVGGAYRWVDAEQRWEQLITASAVPDAPEFPSDYNVEAIAVAPSDPAVVYVAVGQQDSYAQGSPPDRFVGRVLASRDGATTWTVGEPAKYVGGNDEYRQLTERLAVHPTDADTVLWGTRREGVWISRDGGLTFSQVPLEQVPSGRLEDQQYHVPGVAFVSFATTADGEAVAFAGVTGEGVFRSDDDGASWRRIAEAPSAKSAPSVGQVVDGQLFVAFNGTEGDEQPGSVQRYDLAAETWEDITPPREEREYGLAVDPTDPDRMLAGSYIFRDGWTFRSTDGGRSWDDIQVQVDSAAVPWVAPNLAGGYSPTVGRFIFDPTTPGRAWLAHGFGVLRTDDVWATPIVWSSVSNGIEQSVAADILRPPGGDLISVAADTQGFLYADDDFDAYPGAQLVDDLFAGGTDIDYMGTDPDTLVWIGAEYHVYWNDNRRARGAISRDGGQTWSELPNLVKDQFGGNIAVSATDPDNIVWVPSYFINPWEYQGQPKGIFVTTDGGQNWTSLPDVDGSHQFHRLVWWLGRQALAADKVEGGVFYLNDDLGNFWVSTDGGSTWDATAHQPPCFEANACLVHGQIKPSPSVAGQVWVSTGLEGLWRSDDRGATPWQKIDAVGEVRSFGFGAPLPGHADPAIYLHGTMGDDPTLGFWRSPDLGVTWDLVARTPGDRYGSVVVVNGDPDIPGRMYIGYSGTGFLVGDDVGSG